MKIDIRYIYVSGIAAAVIAAITHALTIGYGVKYTSTPQSETTCRPMSTAVIYERNYNGHIDFVHLKIDTTYRKTGKGRLKLETICDRKISLRSFDGKYADCSFATSRCFVIGNDIEWRDTGETRRIMDYECRRATATFDNRTWEVWYTLLLPRCAAGTRMSDHLAGLILEASESKGDYSLKIRHISEIS